MEYFVAPIILMGLYLGIKGLLSGTGSWVSELNRKSKKFIENGGGYVIRRNKVFLSKNKIRLCIEIGDIEFIEDIDDYFEIKKEEYLKEN